MYKFSELPLNRRGAVYHLDLLPEELADIVITVGDPERVPLISRHFDRIEYKRGHREFITHTGYIGSQRVSCLSTGIGLPNIDIVMNELDALANIDLVKRAPKSNLKQLTIVRFGTTGSLDPESKPGDIYASKYAIGFDSLLSYYQHRYSAKMSQFYQKLSTHMGEKSGPFYVAKSDDFLHQIFAERTIPSITATCGGFYAPQGRALRIPLAYPDFLKDLMTFSFDDHRILNFEMETAGILALGDMFGHRCLSLSIALANRMTGEFSVEVTKHVEDLIAEALHLLTYLSSNAGS